MYHICMFAVVPDTTPPVITNCPMDKMETLPEGQIKVGVTWTEPTIVDARGSVSTSSNYQPGFLFSGGTTVVVYEASDSAGNTVNCTFNVHVNGKFTHVMLYCVHPTFLQCITFCRSQSFLASHVYLRLNKKHIL